MSNNPERRWGCEGRGYSGSPHFWNAISKYGWDNFEHEILMTDLSFDEACSREIEMIELLNTTDDRFGYNISAGGNGGRVWRTHPMSIPVRSIAPDGEIIEFEDIKSCGEYYGIDKRSMQNIVHRNKAYELNRRSVGKPQYESIVGYLFEQL